MTPLLEPLSHGTAVLGVGAKMEIHRYGDVHFRLGIPSVHLGRRILLRLFRLGGLGGVHLVSRQAEDKGQRD